MTDKALISAYTWRTLEAQRNESAEMPVFVLPDDLPQLFRPTTRKGSVRYHVQSLAIISKTEKGFRDFLTAARGFKAAIVSRDEGRTFAINGRTDHLVKEWRLARLKGSATVGYKASAAKKKAASKEAVKKIAHLWPLPSSEYTIADLEKLCGKARGTIVSILGPRKVAQYNYQAAQKRKERRNAKAN